jgi:hypothetical protein
MLARKAGVSFAAMVLLMSAVSAASEMYQWVDADGKKHFTDRPPPAGVAVEKAAVPVAPAPGKPAEAGEDASAAGKEPAPDFARQLREKQQKMARERMQSQQQQRLAADEERQKRAAQKKARDKEEKCKRLKDVADQAYGFKARYERECE